MLILENMEGIVFEYFQNRGAHGPHASIGSIGHVGPGPHGILGNRPMGRVQAPGYGQQNPAKTHPGKKLLVLS